MKNILIVNTLLSTLLLSACDKPQKIEQHPSTPKNEPTSSAASEITPKSEEPSAPSMSYKPIYVSDDGIGYDNIFTIEDRGEDFTGKAIVYQSKAGAINIMEQVAEDVDALGYVEVQRAYQFGDKYVLVVSTGENGTSCPATTYAFVYETKGESVTSQTNIDGCSEIVESFAEGNKLTIKKEGEPTVIYNGEIK